MSIPHLFRCPISLDLFTDPVTLSTGQTYDRPSIEKWLADGNLTCPVTMQRLADTTLVPNLTLRHLIDKWLHADPAVDCQHIPMKSTDDADFSLVTLKQNVQSPKATRAKKLESLKKVRALSVDSDVGQACLIQLGFFPLLLQMLFHTTGGIDSGLVEVTLDCVLSLSSCTQLDSLDMVKKHSNLASLILLLDQGNMNIKTSLCHLLEVIASSLATQDLCLIIGESRQVLQILVSLLHDKSNSRASEAAVGAMASICSLESNRSYAIREGAVDGLISHISNSDRRNASRALATLELLLGLEAGKKALVKNPSAIQVLSKMVFRVSTDHKDSEHALGSLLLVCCDSEKMQLEAVNAGVLTQLLLLLQSHCSSKVKIEARSLLKMLRPLRTEQVRGL